MCSVYKPKSLGAAGVHRRFSSRAVYTMEVDDQLEKDAGFMDKYSRQIGAFGIETMAKVIYKYSDQGKEKD